MAKQVHQTGRKLKGGGKCDIGCNPDGEDVLVLSAKEYLLLQIDGGRMLSISWPKKLSTT
jgi:hypothetical protein